MPPVLGANQTANLHGAHFFKYAVWVRTLLRTFPLRTFFAVLGTRYPVTVQVQPTKCGRAGVSTFGLTGDDPKPDHPKSPWCCFLVESGYKIHSK